MSSNHDSFARSPVVHRVVWGSLAAAGMLVLFLAAMLEPDARGYGTHAQLGLPPCGLRALTGTPCPGCGLTTAFAHAVRGDWLPAASANPLGLLLFGLVCLCVPLCIIAAVRNWSVDAVLERTAVGRLGLVVVACAVAMWGFRLAAHL